MNVLGIVPARGGSKRVPRKNIRLLGGIPLISHCLRAAKSAPSINRLVVSTDDAEIAEVARAEGVSVLMRPSELAQDATPTLPVIQHVLSVLEAEGFIADIVLTIQPPYPFLAPEHIEQAVAALAGDATLDSATTVMRAPFHYHPYNARVRHADGTIGFMFPDEKKKCPNSQSAPPVYFFGNLYATRRSTIEVFGNLYGERSFPVMIDPVEAFDIDDTFDMELAEWLHQRREGEVIA